MFGLRQGNPAGRRSTRIWFGSQGLFLWSVADCGEVCHRKCWKLQGLSQLKNECGGNHPEQSGGKRWWKWQAGKTQRCLAINYNNSDKIGSQQTAHVERGNRAPNSAKPALVQIGEAPFPPPRCVDDLCGLRARPEGS